VIDGAVHGAADFFTIHHRVQRSVAGANSVGAQLPNQSINHVLKLGQHCSNIVSVVSLTLLA
jgi:hypothetical protein